MQDVNNLCIHCMKDKGTSATCPHCNSAFDEEQKAPYLPPRTILANRYFVGALISSNGEGASYMGWDKQGDSPVIIREFLPTNLCQRDLVTWEVRANAGSQEMFTTYLNSFLASAKRLARMRDLASLMPIYDIFELGGTAYTVSEYTESITLNDFLIRNGGSLNFEQCRALMMPVLATLCSLHAANIYHKGISPETLMMGKDGKLRLTGFCLPEARTARSDLDAELFSGYCAIEQYGFEGRQGAWTDVYAFAAVIYRILVGNAPPEAPERATNDRIVIPAKIAETLPKHAMVALANALQFLPDDRTASFERFRDELSAAPSAVSSISSDRNAVPTEHEVVSISEEKKRLEQQRKKRSVIYATIALICTVIVLVVGAILLWDKIFPGAGGDSTSSVVSSQIESKEEESVVSVQTGSQTIVPNVVANKLSDMQTKYKGKYIIEVESKRYHKDIEAGVVLEQTPAAGESVTYSGEQLQVIKVVVSLGTEEVKFPSLTSGETYEQVMLKLYSAGFTFDSIEKIEKFVPDQKPGTVLSVESFNESMSSGKSYERDVAITIVVADAASGTALISEPESQPETNDPADGTDQTDNTDDTDLNQ